MTAVAVLIGLGAAVLLLIAGYLAGLRRGAEAREALRAQSIRLFNELTAVQDDLARRSEAQEHSLRATIEEALAPIVQREQLSLDLSRLKSGAGERRDLTNLLDKIAEAGNFSLVVLSDDDGLPLAANGAAQDADRLAANSSLVLLMADRMSLANQPQPLAIMIHDETNRLTLCRIFQVQDKRVTLTAVASGNERLAPTALDPALGKVGGMLANAS